jgi:predicted acyl esterase
LLSEHEHWPCEGGTSYEDNSYNARGGVSFATPPMVERTEVIGPLTATVYVSTKQTEVLLFASLWDIDPDGGSRLLTRGWLKGSLARTNPETSRPWLWQYDFTDPQPVDTSAPQRFDINLVPTANVFQKGHRIGLRISSADQDPAANLFDMLGQGHLLQQQPAWVTVHHDAEHPSVLHVPITDGNRIGTYMSGGSGANRKPGTSAPNSSNGNSWDEW